MVVRGIAANYTDTWFSGLSGKSRAAIGSDVNFADTLSLEQNPKKSRRHLGCARRRRKIRVASV